MKQCLAAILVFVSFVLVATAAVSFADFRRDWKRRLHVDSEERQ